MRPAPDLGEHNQEILGGLLGLSKEEIARLAEEGILLDRPSKSDLANPPIPNTSASPAL